MRQDKNPVGKPPLEGDIVQLPAALVPVEYKAYVRMLGDGNISLGIRRAIEIAMGWSNG
jgi:hypothetical protein